MSDLCNICARPLSEHTDGLACCPFCGSPECRTDCTSAETREEFTARYNRRAPTARERQLEERVRGLEDAIIHTGRQEYDSDASMAAMLRLYEMVPDPQDKEVTP